MVTDEAPVAVTCGGRLATLALKLLTALAPARSVTRTVKAAVDGPSTARHTRRPPAVRVAPVGELSSEYSSVSPTSTSLAATSRLKVCDSFTVTSCCVMTGASLTGVMSSVATPAADAAPSLTA